MYIKELNQKLQQMLEFVQSFNITEMAQKQGQDGTFVYYTLDNEFVSHYPHVHICVSNNDKNWDGKPLRSGNPFKTVASVRLLDILTYQPQDVIFEEIKDSKIDSIHYKKIISSWLNSTISGLKINNKQGNALKCLQDYLNSNESKQDKYFILD